MRRFTITAKLGNMRKAAEFTVYPTCRTVDGAPTTRILIQSDHRICEFDPTTGRGMLSKHVSGHTAFLHLNKFLGATEVLVPPEVIAAAQAVQPHSGDAIGPGVYVA